MPTNDVGIRFRAQGLAEVQGALRLISRDLGNLQQNLSASTAAVARTTTGATTAIAGTGQAATFALTNASGGLTAVAKKGITATNAMAFSLSQLAAQGTVSFRSLATSASGFASFFGPTGAIAGGVVALGLVIADFFSRTRKEAEQTKTVIEELVDAAKGRVKREQPELVARQTERQAIAAVAEAEEALAETRRRIAAREARLTPDVEAVNAERARRGLSLRSTERRPDDAGLAGLRQREKAQLAEIATRQVALNEAKRQGIDVGKASAKATQEVAESEVAALTKVLMAGQATNAERRMAAGYIEQARFKLDGLNQSGRTDAATTIQRAALLDRITTLTDALAGKQKKAAASTDDHAKALQEFIAAIVTANRENLTTLTDLPRIAALEAALSLQLQDTTLSYADRVRTLQQLKDLEEARLRLKAQEALLERDLGRPRPGMAATGDTAPRPMPVAGRPQTPDWQQQLDAEAQAFTDALSQTLAAAVSSALIDGFARGIESGNIGEGFKAVLAGISQGLGSILVQIGQQVIAGSKFIAAAVEAIKGMNPVVALAAGIALVAFGKAIGGRGGRGSSGGGGSYGSVGYGGGSDGITSHIFGPGAKIPLEFTPAGLRSTIGNLRGLLYGPQVPSSDLRALAQPMPQASVFGNGMALLAVESTEGQRVLGTTVATYNRRSG